jgi:hypothetical protein
VEPSSLPTVVEAGQAVVDLDDVLFQKGASPAADEVAAGWDGKGSCMHEWQLG